VFPAVGGFVGTKIGWRTALGLGVVTTFLALAATLVLIPAEAPANPTQNIAVLFKFERHIELLTRPAIAYSIALGTLVGFTFQAISSFFPTFLVEYHGVGTDIAGGIFGLIFGLSAAAQPIAGHISDQYSRDFTIGISVTLALAGITSLLALPTTIGLSLGVSFLGVGLSWPGPIQARFFDRLTEDERGYGFGLLRTVYMLLASSGSVIVGSLADRNGWIAGFGSVLIALILCLVLLGFNRQSSRDL